MKGLSHVAMGQFYEGIKAQTKVMLNDPLPGQKASPEYLRVKYLRGKQTVAGLFGICAQCCGVLLLLGGGRVGGEHPVPSVSCCWRFQDQGPQCLPRQA